MRPARFAELRAVLAGKRSLHAELTRRLNMSALRRLLARENVRLSIRRHGKIAQLIPLPNGWTIIVDEAVPNRDRIVCAAHELAHLWLHHDPYFARHETSIYDVSPPWYDVVREEEADTFAEMMVRGPVPEIASSARGKNENRPRRTTQLELSDPDGDAFAEQMFRHAQSESAPNRIRVGSESLVQFVVKSPAWEAISLDAVKRETGQYPLFDSEQVRPAVDGEPAAHREPDARLVTCPEPVAVAIVKQLARAGYRREAVRLRRTIRETAMARESRQSKERAT